MDRHGERRGLANAIIEIRQDRIADEAGIEGWIARLAPALAAVNQIDALHTVASRLDGATVA
jgi:predicted N-formylglutamate amidohydrolase